MDAAEVPQGFQRHFRRSGLTDPWEPLYSKTTDTAVHMGLVLDDAHCNSPGLVHGGLIAALADNAMGLTCALGLRQAGRDISKGLVTVSLTTDYLGAAQKREWLEIMPEPVKIGGSICFARALINTPSEAIAMAHATFKVL